jgi:hypothetical protein
LAAAAEAAVRVFGAQPFVADELGAALCMEGAALERVLADLEARGVVRSREIAAVRDEELLFRVAPPRRGEVSEGSEVPSVCSTQTDDASLATTPAKRPRLLAAAPTPLRTPFRAPAHAPAPASASASKAAPRTPIASPAASSGKRTLGIKRPRALLTSVASPAARPAPAASGGVAAASVAAKATGRPRDGGGSGEPRFASVEEEVRWLEAEAARLRDKRHAPAKVEDTHALQMLARKWQQAAQEVAQDLARKLSEQCGASVRLGALLDELQVPHELVGFDAESEEFS